MFWDNTAAEEEIRGKVSGLRLEAIRAIANSSNCGIGFMEMSVSAGELILRNCNNRAADNLHSGDF